MEPFEHPSSRFRLLNVAEPVMVEFASKLLLKVIDPPPSLKVPPDIVQSFPAVNSPDVEVKTPFDKLKFPPLLSSVIAPLPPVKVLVEEA